MSRKKIIDFPEIGNISTLDYYELLLSGKRATRNATKTTQSGSNTTNQKPVIQKPKKNKVKKDNSSPYKKKKIDELVPPSPPEELVKLKLLYGCVWGEDAINRKLWVEEKNNFYHGLIEDFESVQGEDMLPVKYKLSGNWIDLRQVKSYLTGELVEYQGSKWEVLWPFPSPVSYPQVDIKSSDGHLASVNISQLYKPEFPDLLKTWIKERKEIEVNDAQITKFYFRFIYMKNSKQKILLLRKHETTGKYFVYKDKQFRWINSDKSTFYCNLTEPPIPMNILSKFTPGPNLRKLYKKYFTSCEVSFPKVAQDEKQFRKEKRCKICEYILDTLDYKQCEYCEHCYHTQCLDPIACKPGFRNLWRCPDCPRCENCLGIYDKLLKCIECNNYFHEKCVDINLLPTPGKIWKCELCAQCIHCKIRPTEASVKWNETINKCNSCDMKWKKNEYCCICEKFWFSKKGRQSRTEQRLSQNDDPEMIECDKCKMWVHLACETSMTPDMWSQFTADKNMKYYCPRCYKEKENNEMLQIVNQLIDLEKNEYFIKKIEEPYYYKVIKNPMFFETMIENAKDGVYFKNSQLLKDHFTLLCENAMHFLKANTEGFKAAKKLLEDGFNLLDTKFLPTKRKKISVPTPQKKHKLEQDLENFSLDLPTSLDVPEFYDFSMDLVLSLPVVTFYPSLTIIINKSDIQPYMGPKPLLSFYPLPSPISYSDPSLSFEELCYICSSFIRPEEVLICNICSRAFHDFCISSGPISSVSNWRCKDCRVCEICNSTQDALNILYCKKCEKGYDVQCLWPNVKGGLYLKDWVCDKCFNCQRCNTCFYHVPGYSPNREDFFSDFSLCFKCKWVVVNKDYCPECSKDWSSPYEESSSQEKILCKSCEFYFHLDCVHDWKGVCGKCYTNSLEYSQIEQGTLEKVQTFLNITAQTSVYQILAKHCIQHRYKIDPELSTLLANFFLTDNFEFMTSNSDIKNFFASRGVEIVKKTTARNSRYGNSRIGKTEGLRVSDIPSVRIPAVKIHRVEHLMNIWSVEWDTSFLIRCLKKILTPLDNIEIVEVFLLPKPSQNANVSVAPVFLWDFDEINSYMDIPKDPDSELYQRCEWTITSNKEISPIVDETLYEEKSDGLRPGDISQDVFINEYTHEQVISSYVKQELPAAVSFINKFEIWLKDHLIDVTQHLLNNNKSLQLAEQKPVKLIKIEKINEKIENDPVFNLQCCLCKDTGEKTISGRLLPCEDSCWVHVNCAYWSFEVKLDEHGNLFNLHLAISRGKKTKCKECNKLGATLNCIAKKCHNSFHFPCTLKGKVYLLENKGILCETCPVPKDITKCITLDTLKKTNKEKIIISRSKKNLRKPSFVPEKFNRIGSLILYEISQDKFLSYRLANIHNQRKLLKCEKKDNYYIISIVNTTLEVTHELYRVQELEDLWPLLKKGDSFVLKSASDFFGCGLSTNFSSVIINPEYYSSIKENKTVLEKIAVLKPPLSGGSKLSPYTKHMLPNKSSRTHISQKSAGYEENPEGKNETILVSEYRKYKKTADRDGSLEVLQSHIHGLGLFTTVDISPGKIVVEYIGEIIRNRVADIREKEYELKGIGQGSCYLFRLDEDHVIDATVQGGKARFINHSCQPNCAASVCEIDGDKHILLFAKRLIHKGEEITYDYNFDVEYDKISCQCGSKDCQGKLN